MKCRLRSASSAPRRPGHRRRRNHPPSAAIRTSSVNMISCSKSACRRPAASRCGIGSRTRRRSDWPVRGRLSSSFGTRRDPFSGEGAFHPGVDIRSRYGSPVVAAADGMVTESGWAGQYGKRVVLSHGRNSLSTHYAHLSEFFVRAGEIVRRGQVIGRTGATGRTTSPHLHYEVRFKGTPVNPYRYLQKSNLRGTSFQFTD